MIGDILKQLRKSMKLSQKELADGICTQAQISKLENGTEIPSSLTLYQIAKKLNVNMDYFFEITSNKRIDYMASVFQVVRDYIRKRDYVSVMNTIEKEKNTPNFTNNTIFKQFLLWHEGVCDYYLLNAPEKSIDKLFTVRAYR